MVDPTSINVVMRRFALAQAEPAPALALAEDFQEPPPEPGAHPTREVTRRVSQQGRISLAGFA